MDSDNLLLFIITIIALTTNIWTVIKRYTNNMVTCLPVQSAHRHIHICAHKVYKIKSESYFIINCCIFTMHIMCKHAQTHNVLYSTDAIKTIYTYYCYCSGIHQTAKYLVDAVSVTDRVQKIIMHICLDIATW